MPVTGCFYVLSMWYKREEAQRRFTLFFGSATLASAFGSLLASGIENMNGVHGKSGWRWIFILEGIATCLFSAGAYFIISDFPEHAKWLTEEERNFMKSRLIEIKSDHEIAFSSLPTSRRLAIYFSDIKTYCGGLMYFGKHINFQD